MLKNIRIVLLNTTHPGNIGATARAMKNMGFSNLVLVSPRHFPNAEAEARASGATDILDNAHVCESLEEAIADCSLVVGTSSRLRHLSLLIETPRAAAKRCIQESQQVQAAILFGEERIGLTNEQLSHCHYQIVIPTSPEYNSLNLAAAVQIMTYECYIASLGQNDFIGSVEELATSAQMEHYFKQLEELLVKKEFYDKEKPSQVMAKLRRLFLRARMNQKEVNIMRGILALMDDKQ